MPADPARASRPLVLCYHAVSDTWSDRLAVTPASFEQQVRYLLGRGFAAAPAHDTLVARRRFHVTFDDAFCNIGGALETLAALQATATVFVVASFADEGRPFDAGRVGRLPRTPELDAERKTMTWEELRAVADRGFEIGSHTVTHPHLTELGDDELGEELRRSREQIEDEIGRPCRYLAYPFGDYDARVARATEAAGYDAAFALASPRRPLNRFAVPRVGLYRIDGPRRAALKLSGLGREAIAARGALSGRARQR